MRHLHHTDQVVVFNKGISVIAVIRFLGLMLLAWQPFVSGARLPSVLLFLLGVWLLLTKRVSLASLASTRMVIVFLLLLVPVLLSIPNSFDPFGSLYVAGALVLYCIVGLALLHGLSKEVDRKWLQRWLLILLLVWVIDGYIQYIVGVDLLGIPVSEDHRILGVFSENLHLGIFLALIMPLVLWNMACTRPLHALVIICLVGFIVGMNGARSSIIMMLLGCALLFFRFPRYYKLLPFLGLFASLIASLLASPTFHSRFEHSLTIDQNSQVTLFEQMDTLSTKRLTLWSNAWRMVNDRPLSGVGANAFAEAYARYAPKDDHFVQFEPPYHAHHMYVSILAETGVVGLVSFVALIVLCIKWFMRSSPENRRQAAPFAAPLIIVIFPVQSQPILYTIWWFPVLLLFFSAMMATLSE